MRSDDAEYRFLSVPGANLKVGLTTDGDGEKWLRFFGNRAGILSFANLMLWLVANSWRRELLSLGECGFVQLESALSICLRLNDEAPHGSDGHVLQSLDTEQFEWRFSEDDLRRVALTIHRLACNPAHEYDRLNIAPQSAAGVLIRMTDAAEWL